MVHTLHKLFAIVVVACVIFTQAQFAQAQAPVKIYMYIHTDPNTEVGSAYPNSYKAFGGIAGTEIVYRDIRGYSREQFRALLSNDFATPGVSNMVVYGGHGQIGGLGTDGNLNFNRAQALEDIGTAATRNGTSASVFVESCGSGIVCNLGRLPNGVNAVYTASTQFEPGWVYSKGGPWYAQFGEEVKTVMRHFGDGSAKDPDKNKDGVVTAGELDDELNKGRSGRSRVENPDAPVFFKNEAIAQKYNQFTECIILRPGQVDETYAGKSSTADGVTTEFKPASISGYGQRTESPTDFPVLGKFRDEKGDESELNFDLRRLGGDYIQKHISSVMSAKNVAAGVVKKIILLPTDEQAEEFIQSLRDDPRAQGTYTLNRMKVDVGKRYIAKHPSPDDKIIFDETCKPTAWTPPEESQDDPNSPGNNNGGNNGGDTPPGGNFGGTPPGGNGGGGSAPTDDGIGGILAQLMQGLLGGGQKNKQANQNQYGAGYGNTTLTCAEQGESPVCGADGKTYLNPCYLLESKTVQVSEGACALPALTIMNQILSSGIPASLLDEVTSLVSLIVSSILSGETVRETVTP